MIPSASASILFPSKLSARSLKSQVIHSHRVDSMVSWVLLSQRFPYQWTAMPHHKTMIFLAARRQCLTT